jgi:malate dehydrogenase (oxaloacetate-decarboxylating)
LKGEDYVKFVQRFAKAFRTVYPNALCQWEDFSKQNAFAIRDSYLHDLISFNDDIQGTGAVTLAGILSAMKIKGEKITEQRFLIHGAGAGGVGIAEQIEITLIEEGLAPAEARGRIFTVDSVGLVTSNRSLQPYKMKFAKDPRQLSWLKSAEDDSLANIVRHEKITVLIGTSGQPGCFSKEIIEAMLANTDRPVVLPLSNPTTKAEALPTDLFFWSNGRTLVATGSPFEPVDFQGKTVRIGQCNNVFIFPGVGLGVLASGARQVLPEFFTAAARAVSEQVSAADLQAGVLFPEIETLREVSKHVAIAVGEAAIRMGVSGLCVYSTFQHNNDVDRLAELIDKMRWQPVYLPLVPM